MKFNTMFGKHKRFFNRSGSPTKPERVLQYDDEGRMFLKQVGEINIYDQIQSYADSVDINNIIERYMQGDESVLAARVGQYFDASNLPDNLAQVYQFVNNGKYLFDSLPTDIKGQFNNSYPEFIANFGSEKFMSVFGKQDPVSVKESEVKPVEES